MLSIIAIIMIVVFLLVILKNKLQIFTALTIVSLVFGVIIVILTGSTFADLFDWLFAGVFYQVDPTTGEIEAGVITASILVMFAVLFFDTLLEAGLFDSAIVFFIKIAKGDPLKIILASFLTSTVISFSGDSTTTIIVCLSLFLPLYKQLGMNLGYLALSIVGPSIILNLLPWGGPTVSISLVTGVELNDIFLAMVPAMVVGYIYIFCVVLYLGKKEQRRLKFDGLESEFSDNDKLTESMITSVFNYNKENKRYQYTWLNVLLLAVTLILLFSGVAHGSILFMLGTAIALFINYRTPKETTKIIELNASDAILPALGSLGAGVFSGVLTNSGMATSLATTFANIIPESLSDVILPIYAVITAIFLIILPTDAFFFGITKVLNNTFVSLGIEPMKTSIASLIGESFAVMSPTIASIHVLVEKTELKMSEYHQLYLKYYGVLLIIWIVMYYFTGQLSS